MARWSPVSLLLPVMALLVVAVAEEVQPGEPGAYPSIQTPGAQVSLVGGSTVSASLVMVLVAEGLISMWLRASEGGEAVASINVIRGRQLRLPALARDGLGLTLQRHLGREHIEDALLGIHLPPMPLTEQPLPTVCARHQADYWSDGRLSWCLPSSCYSLDLRHSGTQKPTCRSAQMTALNQAIPTPKIIGYQVQNADGENWDDRPSYEVLTAETATAELLEARKSGTGHWLMIAILDGDIEDVEFEMTT